MKALGLEQISQVTHQLPENPRLIVSGNFSTPLALVNALDSQLPEYRLNILNAQVGLPNRPGVNYETAFVGPGMRGSERLAYFPARLSLLPRLIKTHTLPDLVVLHTSTPRNGFVSLGSEVNILPAAIESARKHGALVIAQANANMPYTFGDAEISLTDIDYIFDVDAPLLVKEHVEPTQVATLIGHRIAEKIKDGSTLQLGIGAIPDAVLGELRTRTGLRVWTEMFSDGVLGLRDSGALDTEQELVASFVFGSQELYDWINLNPQIRMRRTEVTNSSGNIAQQPQMMSINAALQVDLFDQANSSRVNSRIYSGFGGATDFIIGALNARGGLAFMALPSWHAKTDSSTIVSKLIEPVTSFQHSYVVTEHGAAHCAGESQEQQARNIITFAAHPNARDELTNSAHDLGIF